VDRIRLDEAVSTIEVYSKHCQIVDVFQVFPDTLLGMARVASTNHQIPSRAVADLVGNMPRQNELAIAPFKLNLLKR